MKCERAKFRENMTGTILCMLIVTLLLAGCSGGSDLMVVSVGDGANPSVAARTTILPTGDVSCPYGGTLFETGIDENSNGLLDADEVDSTNAVCNGAPGADAVNMLISLTPEPAGSICANSGVKIETGADVDNSSTLEASEVTSVEYVCNGIDGTSSLVKLTTEAPGANCPNGGEKFEVGQDSNANGVLDLAEVVDVAYICDGSNGTDGLNTLTVFTDELPGANCLIGGKKLDSGLDSDRDGTLSFTEITNTEYICNGIDAGVVTSKDVAVFTNTAYVDYIAGSNMSEASNVYEGLISLGMLSVNTFTGITAADFDAAVTGSGVMVFPEFENGDLSLALDAAATTSIHDFVNIEGGTLLVFGDFYSRHLNFLNGIFGYSLAMGPSSSASSNLNIANATSTPFATGPTSLPDFSATHSILSTSLPLGAKAIYEIGVGGDNHVTVIPVGAGNIVILGWDWYNAVPIGAEDGGWLEVLNLAMYF